MNDSLSLLPSLIVGILLGAIFFGGLWWTLKKGLSSDQPGLWFFSSFVMRTSIALTGFYLIGHGYWQKLLVCLLGFIVGRLIVNQVIRVSYHAS